MKRRLPLLGSNGHADAVEQCPLLEDGLLPAPEECTGLTADGVMRR